MSGEKGKFAVYVRNNANAEELKTRMDAQQTACIQYALLLGFSEDQATVICEVGSAGTVERPKLNELRRMAEGGEFEAVFVYSADRLSRGMLDLLELVREFNTNGVEVHFVKGSSDSWYEDGLAESMLELASRHRRAKAGERSRRVKMALARGGRISVGALGQPIGYKVDPVLMKRVVDEGEAEVVRRIFRLYDQGASMPKIAKMLNDEGVPTKRGCLWSAAAIRRVLTNSSYIGVDYYGKTRTVYYERGVGKRVAVPRDEWIAIRGHSPELVSEALFDAVNERLDSLRVSVGEVARGVR